MKIFLYFIVCSTMTVGVFLTLLYLMTVIDPGLLELPTKAARMMQANRGGGGVFNEDTSLLPPENYVDFEEFMKKHPNTVLALFGVFCFLMGTVNPPPIKTEERSEKVSEKYRESNLVNFYLRNMDPSEDLEYGLEKAYDSPAPQSSPAPYHQLINLTNLIPTVKYKNPHLVKVYPPIWPPSTKTAVKIVKTTSKETNNILTATTIINTTITKSITKDKININRENTTVTEPTSRTTKVLESPIHRRSINSIERMLDKETGSVILKILDDDGQSRIEIKLSPNEIFENKKSRMHRSSLKTDAKFSMVTEGNNNDVDINELPENTEIKILPNDTVVIANNVYDLGIETVDFANKTYDNLTDNNTNVTQYIDKETVTLDIENKTVDIERILYTIESKTETSTSKDVVLNKTEAVINSTQIPQLIEKIDHGRTETLNTTTETLKEEIEIEKTVPLITTTEDFGLQIMFDNLTRSFTDPHIIYVSENKTNN